MRKEVKWPVKATRRNVRDSPYSNFKVRAYVSYNAMIVRVRFFARAGNLLD
jgi:hypothetical protein